MAKKIPTSSGSVNPTVSSNQPKGSVLDQLVSKPATKAQVSRKDIELAAYFRWISRGRPYGDPLADWLAAEKQFKG